MEEMFESATRSAGDFAGVFEFDGETGYFYLYNTNAREETKVVGAMRVVVGVPNFSETDISIKWDRDEQRVGLFISNKLWAVFDSETGTQFGGNYRVNSSPNIATDVARKFVGFTRG